MMDESDKKRRGKRYKSLADRILSNTVKVGECWCSTFTKDRNGYARMSVRVSGVRHPVLKFVHREAYEVFTGKKIPPDMTLDHKFPDCQHKTCWRPEHLEVVTRAENTSRKKSRRNQSKSPTKTRRSGNRKFDKVTFP